MKTGEFPQSQGALLANNYQYKGTGVCKGCNKPIEWWKTPRGKSIPMDPMPENSSDAVAHWTTCTNAGDFRKPADTPAPSTSRPPNGTFKSGAKDYVPPSRPFQPAEISDDDIPF